MGVPLLLCLGLSMISITSTDFESEGFWSDGTGGGVEMGKLDVEGHVVGCWATTVGSCAEPLMAWEARTVFGTTTLSVVTGGCADEDRE